KNDTRHALWKTGNSTEPPNPAVLPPETLSPHQQPNPHRRSPSLSARRRMLTKLAEAQRALILLLLSQRSRSRNPGTEVSSDRRRNMTLSEKEKMLAGKLYRSTDRELQAALAQTKRHLRKLNTIPNENAVQRFT